MNQYLLDTHIFIWASCYPEKLSNTIAERLQNPNDDFYISMATIWEMQIKYQLGKLLLTKSLSELVAQVKKYQLYNFLPINDTHILNLQQLPFIHKDPFDRLLVSQAMTENLTLITVDEHIIQYPIEFIN